MKVDELLDNRYTDTSGQVQIPVPGLTEGTLFYTVQDEFGNTVLDSIPVGSLVDVPKISVQSISLHARPNVFQGETRFEFGSALPQSGQLEIYSTSGRLVARINVSRGDRAIQWKGTDSSGAERSARTASNRRVSRMPRRRKRMIASGNRPST